jgi:hypothetical protein
MKNVMKRLLWCTSFALMSITLLAQNTLTIHQKDGQQLSFGFEDKPVIKFTNSEIVLTSAKTELRFQFANVAKLTFDDVEDAVVSIKADGTKASITLDEYTVSISGAKVDAVVHLIVSDGKLLQSYRVGQEGTVTFSISDLPDGTYIISSESLTVKILKK